MENRTKWAHLSSKTSPTARNPPPHSTLNPSSTNTAWDDLTPSPPSDSSKRTAILLATKTQNLTPKVIEKLEDPTVNTPISKKCKLSKEYPISHIDIGRLRRQNHIKGVRYPSKKSVEMEEKWMRKEGGRR